MEEPSRLALPSAVLIPAAPANVRPVILENRSLLPISRCREASNAGSTDSANRGPVLKDSVNWQAQVLCKHLLPLHTMHGWPHAEHAVCR